MFGFISNDHIALFVPIQNKLRSKKDLLSRRQVLLAIVKQFCYTFSGKNLSRKLLVSEFMETDMFFKRLRFW